MARQAASPARAMASQAASPARVYIATPSPSTPYVYAYATPLSRLPLEYSPRSHLQLALPCSVVPETPLPRSLGFPPPSGVSSPSMVPVPETPFVADTRPYSPLRASPSRVSVPETPSVAAPRLSMALFADSSPEKLPQRPSRVSPSVYLATGQQGGPDTPGADGDCPICCVASLRDQRGAGQLARLDCCEHSFCFSCVRRWVEETTSTCPLCKRDVCKMERVGPGRTVHEFLAVGARVARPFPTTPDDLVAEAEFNAHYNCVVCDYGGQEDLLLLCDSCDLAYHTYCLRPSLPNVPAGPWFCPDCHDTPSRRRERSPSG